MHNATIDESKFRETDKVVIVQKDSELFGRVAIVQARRLSFQGWNYEVATHEDCRLLVSEADLRLAPELPRVGDRVRCRLPVLDTDQICTVAGVGSAGPDIVILVRDETFHSEFATKSFELWQVRAANLQADAPNTEDADVDAPIPYSVPDAHMAPEQKDTNPKDAIGETKTPLSLLSPVAKAHWSLAQLVGKAKYGGWNWRAAGVKASIYLDAIDRHRDGFLSGETHDPVDGTHHLGNIMACCAIILDAEAAGKLIDDRPPSVDHRPTYAFVEALIPQVKAKYAHLEPHHYTIADTERCK